MANVTPLARPLYRLGCFSAQADFVTERTKVSELNNELNAINLQPRDWDEQYDWQYRAGAGANDQPPKNKDPTARKLIQPAGEEEPPRTPPPRARPEEPGSTATDLRNPVASPTHSQAEVLSATAAKFKEAERIRISAWPKPASYRQWRMNRVDEIVAASARPKRFRVDPRAAAPEHHVR